jgi:hypothetical protein
VNEIYATQLSASIVQMLKFQRSMVSFFLNKSYFVTMSSYSSFEACKSSVYFAKLSKYALIESLISLISERAPFLSLCMNLGNIQISDYVHLTLPFVSKPRVDCYFEYEQHPDLKSNANVTE